MRAHGIRTSLSAITLLGLALSAPVAVYGDDTHRNRRQQRRDAHAARDAERHAERHRNQGYGDQGYYGNDPYRDPNYRDPYSRNRTGAYDAYGREGYGYGNSGNVIDRVLYNLNVAASNSAGADSHERGHFNKAQEELRNFQTRWAQGRFDTGRLDKAMSAMRDLANSNQVNSRDRSVIANDISALQQFRSSGGQGAYAPLRSNNPYVYRNVR